MTILIVGQGEAYQSIQAAIDAAVAGDEVRVRDGIYPETVRVDKAITLRAEDGHQPVVDGGWDGKTLEGEFGGTVACAAEGATVEGLFVRNCPGRGIGISASNITVRNNRIDFTYKGGIGANAPAGTYLTGLLVEGNVMTRLGQERIVTKGGKVNGSFLFAQVRDSVIRGNTVANGLGEGINVDRGSSGLLVEGNTVINSAHVGIYINRATGNIVRGNTIIYTGDPKPVGDKDDAPSGIIIGDENGSGNWPPSSGNVIEGNIVVGSGKLFQVRNNAHNYDTRLDENTIVRGNTFIAGPKTMRGLDILANVQGRPHGAAQFYDNVIDFTTAPPGADIGTNSSNVLVFHHNAWSSPPPQRMRGEGDILGDPMLANPAAPLRGDWVGTETGFSIDNYRPMLVSPLIGASHGGGTIGALEPLAPEPPPPDPPEQEPVDWDALANRAAAAYGLIEESQQRLSAARDELLLLIGVLDAQPR